MAPTDFPESQQVTTKPETVTRNLPWVEKYRPQKLDDLISHADILGINGYKAIPLFILNDLTLMASHRYIRL